MRRGNRYGFLFIAAVGLAGAVYRVTRSDWGAGGPPVQDIVVASVGLAACVVALIAFARAGRRNAEPDGMLSRGESGGSSPVRGNSR